jgi:hypothetical protein
MELVGKGVTTPVYHNVDISMLINMINRASLIAGKDLLSTFEVLAPCRLEYLFFPAT